MRFLANENFPAAAIETLKAAGHDVVWVRITAPGTADPDVLAWAAREERLLLTFDKDFGEWARASALPSTCGVILFRMPMPRPGDAGRRDLPTSSPHGTVGPVIFLSSSQAAFVCARWLDPEPDGR
jgi:hypothetical protein